MPPPDAPDTQTQSSRLRVLVAAPSRSDTEVLQRVLNEAGFEAVVCAGIETLCAQIANAETAVLAEEALTPGAEHSLAAVLQHQPEWADFPLIVMTAGDVLYQRSWRLFEQVEGCAHPILLQRPVRKYALLSTVRAAVRARARQYQVRDELIQRRRAEAALREADRRKDEFLAMLGHELRNPLASISTALEVAGMTSDAAKVAQSRMIMERQVGYLARLVDDLLEVARVTQGKLQLDRRSIELAAIINNAVEDTEDLIRERRHELTITLGDEPVSLYADPVRLGQVFANLLSNAAKYTPEGGRIDLSAEVDTRGVCVSVRDDGLGIPPDKLEPIFEMFGQVENALDRRQRGLGIGLSLVKSLVELHGGTIHARSQGLGSGSEFRVWLPVAADTEAFSAEAGADARASAPPSPARRVLLAEDNEDAARSLSALVELLGHEVRIAPDGQAAVELAAEFRPHLVLLDLGLPKLSGYDVALRLRAEPRGNEPVLAAITGWSQEQHRQQAKEAGFDVHLTKPITLQTLQALLDRVSTHEADAELPPRARKGPARVGEHPVRQPGTQRSAE